MVILSQSRRLILKEFEDLFVQRYQKDRYIVGATPVSDKCELYVLGEYEDVERCEEILYEIVEAYREDCQIFEMPKE